jgi:hypothetical protein
MMYIDQARWILHLPYPANLAGHHEDAMGDEPFCPKGV